MNSSKEETEMRKINENAKSVEMHSGKKGHIAIVEAIANVETLQFESPCWKVYSFSSNIGCEEFLCGEKFSAFTATGSRSKNSVSLLSLSRVNEIDTFPTIAIYREENKERRTKRKETTIYSYTNNRKNIYRQLAIEGGKKLYINCAFFEKDFPAVRIYEVIDESKLELGHIYFEPKTLDLYYRPSWTEDYDDIFNKIFDSRCFGFTEKRNRKVITESDETVLVPPSKFFEAW